MLITTTQADFMSSVLPSNSQFLKKNHQQQMLGLKSALVFVSTKSVSSNSVRIINRNAQKKRKKNITFIKFLTSLTKKIAKRFYNQNLIHHKIRIFTKILFENTLKKYCKRLSDDVRCRIYFSL